MTLAPCPLLPLTPTLSPSSAERRGEGDGRPVAASPMGQSRQPQTGRVALISGWIAPGYLPSSIAMSGKAAAHRRNPVAVAYAASERGDARRRRTLPYPARGWYRAGVRSAPGSRSADAQVNRGPMPRVAGGPAASKPAYCSAATRAGRPACAGPGLLQPLRLRSHCPCRGSVLPGLQQRRVTRQSGRSVR